MLHNDYDKSGTKTTNKNNEIVAERGSLANVNTSGPWPLYVDVYCTYTLSARWATNISLRTESGQSRAF